MLVIRLYKCTGKEVPEIDGFRWLAPKSIELVKERKRKNNGRFCKKCC